MPNNTIARRKAGLARAKAARTEWRRRLESSGDTPAVVSGGTSRPRPKKTLSRPLYSLMETRARGAFTEEFAHLSATAERARKLEVDEGAPYLRGDVLAACKIARRVLVLTGKKTPDTKGVLHPNVKDVDALIDNIVAQLVARRDSSTKAVPKSVSEKIREKFARKKGAAK